MKIAFTTSPNWFSRAIRWFTKSQWSHCLLILDDSLWEDALIFEASAWGVRISLWSKYESHAHEVYSINRPCTSKVLYKFLGAKYGYLQIFGDALAKTFKLKHNPFTKDYVCSEIVLRFLKENGFNEFDVLDPNLASPEDLRKILLYSNNFSSEAVAR